MMTSHGNDLHPFTKETGETQHTWSPRHICGGQMLVFPANYDQFVSALPVLFNICTPSLVIKEAKYTFKFKILDFS